MKNAFKLTPLRTLAQERLDTATRELCDLNLAKTEADRKLQMLIDFRNEYQGKFEIAARNGTDGAGLRNFCAFMHKLDDAIRQQVQVTKRCNESLESSRLSWLAAQRKMKSLNTLSERQDREQLQLALTREQRETDERAVTAWSRTRAEQQGETVWSAPHTLENK